MVSVKIVLRENKQSNEFSGGEEKTLALHER
jgi:hypothetical protein